MTGAESVCDALSAGKIATPKIAILDQFITQLYNKERRHSQECFWISVRKNSSGIWVWPDKSSVNWTNWAFGHPTGNDGDDCAMMAMTAQ